MILTNRIAVSVAAKDNKTALIMLNRLRPLISLAEIRLDLMQEYDLARLIKRAPCPLLITCRPLREGGRFEGGEQQRLEILHKASALGCAYVDIEWDALDNFDATLGSAQVVVSRHFYDTMPADLTDIYSGLRRKADIVKLVGFANRIDESLRILDLVANAAGPIVGIAMGGAGLITRLLAPCFERCFLSYGAVSKSQNTAAGQITVKEMVHSYALNRVGPHTNIEISLIRKAPAGDISCPPGVNDGRRLYLSVNIGDQDPAEIESRLLALRTAGTLRVRLSKSDM